MGSHIHIKRTAKQKKKRKQRSENKKRQQKPFHKTRQYQETIKINKIKNNQFLVRVCVVRFIHQACLWMCVLFYFLFVCLHVCAYAFKSKVHCESAFAPGAFVRPFYCAPPVCVPDVIAVWRQNTKNNKEQVQHIHKIIIQIITQPTSTTNIQVHHFKTTFHILNPLPTY